MGMEQSNDFTISKKNNTKDDVCAMEKKVLKQIRAS